MWISFTATHQIFDTIGKAIMKFALVLLLVLPLAMAASVSFDDSEDIDKRMSFDDVVKLLKMLNLSGDCVKACEANVSGFVQFLCDAACKVILAR